MISRNSEKNTRVAFYTLGCKVNQYESQALAERLVSLGCEVVPPDEKADIYVINSCTVTGLADRKSRNLARRSKRLNPNALTVLAGCYAETVGESLKGMPEVDMLVGNSDKKRLPELLADHIFIKTELPNCEPEVFVTGLAGRARAYVKIEDGCDRCCSYCIVPRVRGGVRSRGLDDIAAEASALVANGYKEIVLTGVNAALYGRELGLGIIDVVDAVSSIGGDFRIRLSSLEPTVIDAAYVRELVKRERLCPHLHLSLQSGSDAVLSAMRRGYTMGDYIRIVEALKMHDPLFSITTDIIAGFPGETDADHEASLGAVREVGFSRVHVFRYSRRAGTPAANMDGQVPSSIKAERSHALISEGAKSAESFMGKNIGSRRRVLFYEPSFSDRGAPTGSARPEDELRAQITPSGIASRKDDHPSPKATYRGITDNDIEIRMESKKDISNAFKYVSLGWDCVFPC